VRDIIGSLLIFGCCGVVISIGHSKYMNHMCLCGECECLFVCVCVCVRMCVYVSDSLMFHWCVCMCEYTLVIHFSLIGGLLCVCLCLDVWCAACEISVRVV